jgi:pimeloyl-ACP methyl ester carboxylesterase
METKNRDLLADVQISSIPANGISFTFLEKGEGPLILCLHGFPDHAYSFAHQLDAFAKVGYRVAAPFMRGYDPSGPAPNAQYHAAYLGQDAVALIEALGYEKAVLLGHDLGASAAYAASLIAPEKISAVISCAVPYGPKLFQAMIGDPLQQRRSWYVFYFQTPLAELAIPLNDFDFIDQLWKDWSPKWHYPKAAMDGVKKTLGRLGVLAAALGYYRSPFAGVPEDPFLAGVQSRIGTEQIGVPTLYIHGAQDGCIGAYICEGMEGLFSGRCEKQIIDGAGHFVHQEVPEEFNRRVLNFIR